ncbi:MAG TPA: hypothetical protein VNX21_04090, partial [Candidatus Thermoplasmatota archaeon]|nr:hypothetical protein [Candidatus Thermoplasmatota archaeon]
MGPPATKGGSTNSAVVSGTYPRLFASLTPPSAVTMFSLREGVRGSTDELVRASGIDVFLYTQG